MFFRRLKSSQSTLNFLQNFKELYQRSMYDRLESICGSLATNAWRQIRPQEQAFLTRFRSSEQFRSYGRGTV